MSYYPQQPPPGDWAPRPVKKPSKWVWILGGIAAVLALCVGGTVAIGLAAGSGNDTPAAVAASIAADQANTATTPTTGPATLDTSPTATPSGVTPSATPKPTSTPKATTKPATKKPTTKATTRPAPTTATTHTGVRAGAFCSEHGDYGLTSKGTLMKCKTSSTENRYRWRAA